MALARPFHLVSANNTTPILVGAETRLTGYDLTNANAAVVYVKLFWVDGATPPTVGTTVPDYVIACTPTGAATPANRLTMTSPIFKRGVLYVAVTTGRLDSDNTAGAANDILGTLHVEGGVA